MDPKVRDRTTDELLVRKKEFLKICDILDILNINYFLTSGILLGAVRDNDFIKWDWDIEISVFTNELLPKIDLVSNELKKANFKIEKIIKIEKCPRHFFHIFFRVQLFIWRFLPGYGFPAKQQ